MKRLLQGAQWLLSFSAFVIVIAAHLAFRADPGSADAEQYRVLSAYVDPGLTGYSHDLGSRTCRVVIAARTTFSQPIENSNKLKQYWNLVLSTGRARSSIPALSGTLIFEYLARNLKDITLERKFGLGAAYALATEEEMKVYPSDEFIARFPESYGALTF